MASVYALLISAVLVGATVVIHYEVLTSRWPTRSALKSVRVGMIRVMVAIFFAHFVEITLYATAFYIMHDHLGLGTVAGARTGSLMDFFYFSSVSYTTLGFGDVYPAGPIRIVVGVESLNGLVLIGWSTSFTFLAMQRFARTARRLASSSHSDES